MPTKVKSHKKTFKAGVSKKPTGSKTKSEVSKIEEAEKLPEMIGAVPPTPETADHSAEQPVSEPPVPSSSATTEASTVVQETPLPVEPVVPVETPAEESKANSVAPEPLVIISSPPAETQVQEQNPSPEAQQMPPVTSTHLSSPINISTGVNPNIPSPDSVSGSDDGSSTKKKIIVGCLLLLVFVLLGIGIYLFRKESAKNSAKPATTAQSETSAPKTETPVKPQIDLTKYSIKVLNGSGVGGEAAKVKTALESAGFKVSGTGNAKTDTFKETEIDAKKNTDPDYLKKLNEELAKSYSVDTQSAELTASDSADVVVTVGSAKP